MCQAVLPNGGWWRHLSQEKLPSSLHAGSAHKAFPVSKQNVILEQLSGKGCSNLSQ